MQILRNIEVPTGNILILQGEKGRIEMLSLGDYGKNVNVKCNSMGLTREPSPVRHTRLLPLEEKWVITISTQYGCSIGCKFCDVPKVGKGVNISMNDLIGQVKTGMSLHPNVKAKRINLHFARMGEPTFNSGVLSATKWLSQHLFGNGTFHPVVSTMMPRHNSWLELFIREWMRIKNDVLDGNAGLQLSINSTNENERRVMFNYNACSFSEISEIMRQFKPKGRKITLNFAVANYEINPDVLLRYFDPAHYLVKLTPMHKTHAAEANSIKTDGDYTEYYPYQAAEQKLIAAGYDVLVFIASREEDEGRITCGNAILSGSNPFDKKEPPETL